MNCKELIEYLRRFDGAEPVSIVAVDLKSRTAATWGGAKLMDAHPAIVLEIKSMDGVDKFDETEEAQP